MEKIQAFKDDYNGFRPHSSLCGLTPNQVVERHRQTRNSLLWTGIEKGGSSKTGNVYS
ncbi:MAG: hypothetical protein KA746_09980 [Pyrinomonadaceae bacterium]|nr:hypothetical protein [Pyrinomonadaceae bacterium]